MFLNTQIVGSEDIDILLLLVVHMVLNIKNAIVSIKLNITAKQYGAVRQILTLIHLDLKQKKENLVLTYLSTSIAKRNIRQIVIAVLSENIDSTESSM